VLVGAGVVMEVGEGGTAVGGRARVAVGGTGLATAIVVGTTVGEIGAMAVGGRVDGDSVGAVVAAGGGIDGDPVGAIVGTGVLGGIVRKTIAVGDAGAMVARMMNVGVASGFGARGLSARNPIITAITPSNNATTPITIHGILLDPRGGADLSSNSRSSWSPP